MAANDIERAIGRLEADAESSRNQRKLIFEKLDKLLEQTAVLPAMNKHIADHCDELKVINNMVQQVKGGAKAVRWIWIALAALVGSGGFGFYVVAQDVKEINTKTQALWGYFAPVRDK